MSADQGAESIDSAPPVPALAFEGVTKRYTAHDAPAVAGIDLSVAPGEFFSVLGPSGSGKTTVLKIIAGLEAPTDGMVRIEGRDVSRVPAHKRDVNTVFQSYALFPHMRVEENVAYPLRMRKVGKAEIKTRVAEMLERVDLTGYERRRPLELSGGQRQRVALARALVGHPPVLLLDEPLGALDLKLREAMLLMLKRLQRELEITFVYVTHDQGEALAMSDRVAVMNSGRIEQIAPPLELYARPATPFVAAFIGKTNLLECRAIEPGRVAWGPHEFAAEVPADSERMTLSLRPEDIVIGAGSESCDCSLRGEISETLFLGHEVEVRIQLGAEVLTARSSASLAPVRGESIGVGWDREAPTVVGSASATGLATDQVEAS